MNWSKKTAVAAIVLGLGFVALMTTSCSKSSSPAKMTLYDSLGGTVMVNDPAHSGTMIEKGRLGIRSVVDSAIFIIAGDASINVYFKTLLAEVGTGNLSGFQLLSKNLTDFIAVAAGAKDYTYGGKNMHDAHNPTGNPRMNGTATSADFTEFINDVVKSAQKNGLSSMLIGQVGVVLNSVESQVVQR